MESFHMLVLAVLNLIGVVIGVAASREMGEGQSELENHVSRRDASQEPHFLALQEKDGNVLLHAHLFPNASKTFSFPNETLLQAECTNGQRRWNRCNILSIEDTEGLEQLLLFPVRGGVSLAHFDRGISSILNYTRISSDGLSCQPTTLWRQQNEIHLFCLHLNYSTSVGECEIYRMTLHLNTSALNHSYFEGQGRIFRRDYPDLLTNFLISDNLQSCFVPGPQLHFAWFDRLFRSVPNQFVANNYYLPFTGDCAKVTEVESYDPLHISALCPNKTLESVNLCTGNIEHWNITTGLPRTCSHSTETTVYIKNNSFVIAHSSSSTPAVVEVDTSNVTDTRCIQGNSTAWLIIESNNSTVTMLRTDDSSILTLTTNNTLEGVSVGRVQVWGERYIGFGNGTHYLVKDTNCLHGSPLFVLLYIPSLSLQLGDFSFECTESSTVTDVAMTELPTVVISTSPEQSRTPSILGYAAAGVIPVIIIVGLILVIPVAGAIWWKRRKCNFPIQQGSDDGNRTTCTASSATPGPTQKVNGQNSGDPLAVSKENHACDSSSFSGHPNSDHQEGNSTDSAALRANDTLEHAHQNAPPVPPNVVKSSGDSNGTTSTATPNPTPKAKGQNSGDKYALDGLPLLECAGDLNSAHQSGNSTGVNLPVLNAADLNKTPSSLVGHAPNASLSLELHTSGACGFSPSTSEEHPNSNLQGTNSSVQSHEATPSPKHKPQATSEEHGTTPVQEEGTADRPGTSALGVYSIHTLLHPRLGGGGSDSSVAPPIQPTPNSPAHRPHEARNRNHSTQPVTGTDLPLPPQPPPQPPLQPLPQAQPPAQAQQPQFDPSTGQSGKS